MNWLKLKEENAVIRAELREKYEGQIRGLDSAIAFKDARILNLEKAEAELNAIKQEKEELEWSKARKNAATGVATTAAAGASLPANADKSKDSTKKTGLEREKEDL